MEQNLFSTTPIGELMRTCENNKNTNLNEMLYQRNMKNHHLIHCYNLLSFFVNTIMASHEITSWIFTDFHNHFNPMASFF